MAEWAAVVEEFLKNLLSSQKSCEGKLYSAMGYASLKGGKRLRPFLTLQSAKLFEASEQYALRVGTAIELIHCYSLVHDDLPAMDNDSLRRGRPSCHIAFDEATAILAGDALQVLAFEILSDPKTHPDPNVRVALVRGLAIASGGRGMVGGQMIDLESENCDVDFETISRMQRLKTGALISFSCEAGAILGKASEEEKGALIKYAQDIGLAFQIADDLLDVLGTEEATGKTINKDCEAGKATFVSLLGISQAQKRAQFLIDKAIGQLDMFGDKAANLKAIADFIVERRA
ncbi:MAG: farnesyl-diphosphate synthase [Rhodospirillaceae bacterium]|nr:farnesyl-diphosphate synthase [Rhodospirillaceae bacterium]